MINIHGITLRETGIKPLLRYRNNNRSWVIRIMPIDIDADRSVSVILLKFILVEVS